MKKEELLRRYVYACTKSLSKSSREDVAKELNTLIEDMLEERCAGEDPSDKDVKIVLMELGTPAEIAAKYKGDDGRYLIGPGYFSAYKTVMKIVLLCVVFAMAVAHIVMLAIGEKAPILTLGSWVAGTISGIIGATGIVTIIFAIFEYKKVNVAEFSGRLEDLPPVPENNLEIKKYDPILGIVFSVIFIFLFLIFPDVRLAWMNGEFISIFNGEFMRSSWYIILAFGVLGIVRECVRLIDGRYTKRVLAVTIVDDLISAVLVCILLLGTGGAMRIFNPQLAMALPNEQVIQNLFGNFNLFLAGIIVFSLCLDMGTVIYRYIKSK